MIWALSFRPRQRPNTPKRTDVRHIYPTIAELFSFRCFFLYSAGACAFIFIFIFPFHHDLLAFIVRFAARDISKSEAPTTFVVAFVLSFPSLPLNSLPCSSITSVKPGCGALVYSVRSATLSLHNARHCYFGLLLSLSFVWS